MRIFYLEQMYVFITYEFWDSPSTVDGKLKRRMAGIAPAKPGGGLIRPRNILGGKIK